MSFNEKTRSVPSRPMGLLPRVALRKKPNNRRERQRSENDHAPGAGRRQRPNVVETHADHGDRDQEEKEEGDEKGDHRTTGQLRMGSRENERGEPTAPVPPTSSSADLVRLRHLRLDSGRILSKIEPNAFGAIEDR